MFLKGNILKSIKFKNTVPLPFSYWVLVTLRFALTLLPQTGYIHPDEYFQNVEVIAGDIFDVDVARTWEFDPKFPIRNIFIPKLILGPPLFIIRFLNPFIKHYFKIDLRSPYFLLVIPRLFICLLSFINDYCLYKLCIMYGQNFRNRLKIFASSYVVLIYCCRSFSNTFEMLFFSILLYLVGDCMLKSDNVIYHQEYLQEKYKHAVTPMERVKIYKMQTHLPQHSLNNVLSLASLVVIGIFNRPTFIGFALIPIFFWLHRGIGSKIVGFADFHARIFMLVVCGIPMVLLCILVDSAYYGYLTLADIESLQITWSNWVVTPLNFLRYNMDVRKLTKHGIHPRWLHLAVNVPILFNVLGFLAGCAVILNTYRFVKGQYTKMPKIQSIRGLMLLSAITPLAVLSLFPHQEARFIIPILVPLVYLYGNSIHICEVDDMDLKTLKKLLIIVWYGLNIIFAIFFGFIHQGGIYPFINDLHYENNGSYGSHMHVITTHSYSIPTYLLQLESTTKIWKDRTTKHSFTIAPSTFIHKYGSLLMDQLFMNVDEVLTNAEMRYHKYKKKYKLYVVSPCSLEKKLFREASKYQYINLLEHRSYYPHFCTEAFPNFPSKDDKSCVKGSKIISNNAQTDLTLLDRISCFVNQFCLKVFHVKVNETYTL
ncbi:GPI mannosyltransferase 4 [Pieris brassicae]|uniref:GPI mannosyltransferase 4 n=1 Tax=Pieris brassicae TaxID=7116 RepID=UPI001E65E455|nr:GPI mannosyltransferase 4 [Pieris brassicae]